MARARLVTLSKTHFLYIALILFVIFPVIALTISSPNPQRLWCQRFELPEYEKTLGFKLGDFVVPTTLGSTVQTIGVAFVEPGGAFARAGIRPGDVPYIYHGLIDLCATLQAATRGQTMTLRVLNVADFNKDGDQWREVVVQVTPQTQRPAHLGNERPDEAGPRQK